MKEVPNEAEKPSDNCENELEIKSKTLELVKTPESECEPPETKGEADDSTEEERGEESFDFLAFLLFESKDLRCLTYLDIISVIQDSHSEHLFSNEHSFQ